MAVDATGLGEPDVYIGDVPVQHPVEAAHPGLQDVLLAQFGQPDPRGVLVVEVPKRPAGKVYVGIAMVVPL